MWDRTKVVLEAVNFVMGVRFPLPQLMIIVIRKCKHHGETEFVIEGRGWPRCRKCRSESVIKRRRKVKSLLVNYFGGACKICGYDKCNEALDFHHLDPTKKEFGIASGHTLKFELLLQEAKKCILLCCRCHAEVECGLTKIDALCGVAASA